MALSVYCTLPRKEHHGSNLEVQNLAKIIERNPDAVKMKIANFWGLDPELKRRGLRGLPHGSKMDEKVWNEFYGNWENLVYENERLVAKYTAEHAAKHPGEHVADVAENKYEIDLPQGKEREQIVRAREKQGFFRKAILSSYSEKCCITGLKVPDLLIASHIIPWSANEQQRLNPHNGLCLNALHDKAFDRGLITVSSTNYKVMLSSKIHDLKASKAVKEFFGKFDGKKIAMPEKFFPEKEFLEYHKSEIFKR